MKEQKPIRSHNPNKWGKHLAPWFTEECRTSRNAYVRLRRAEGRNSEVTQAALKVYRAECIKGKYSFAKELPDMLKYKPKQFWGMLKRRSDQSPNIDL